MPSDRKLIYLAAFDRGEDGELVSVFERQIESVHEAIDEAREIADRHDGVVAWVLGSAALTCANTVRQKSYFGWGSYLLENCENMLIGNRNIRPVGTSPTSGHA